MKRFILDGALILVATAFLHAPMFLGLNTSTTDHLIHYRWASQFAESLAAGVISPSWEATSRGGLGDPVFVFYPPLFYYAVAAVDVFLQNIWLSIRILLVLTSVATGAGVLAITRARGLTDLSARSVAVLAVGSPMLLGIAGFINAYPWFLATNLLFFAAFALAWVLETGRPDAHLLLAALVGAVGLTHTLSALMFVLVVFLAVVIEWIRTGFADTRRWLMLGAALALGLAISAASLLPAMLGTRLITPSAWMVTLGLTWSNTFVLPVFTEHYRVAISFIVPTFQLAFLVLLLVLALRGGRISVPVRILLFMAAISLFLASELSYPLWDFSTALQFTQRPFRFLACATAVMPVCLTFLLSPRNHVERPAPPQAPRPIAGLALASLATLALLQARVVFITVDKPEKRTETTVALRDEVYFTPEHLIREAGPGWQDFLDSGGWQAACAKAGVGCTARAETPEHFVWSVEASAPVSLSFPLIAFPAWQVALNGTPVPLGLDPATGLVRVDLPAGPSVVDAQWVPLPEQRIGRTISLAAALALLLFWIGTRRRQKAPSSVFRRRL
jgi:6-pyruvoyl-tetrahydropterin synthase related domain